MWRIKRQLVTLIVSFFSFSILTRYWKVGCSVPCPPVDQNIKPFACHYGYVFTASSCLISPIPHYVKIARIKKFFVGKISKVMCLHNLCEKTKVSVLKRYGPWRGGKPVLENFSEVFFSILRIMLTMML